MALKAKQVALTPDLCIVGSGSAALTVAATGALLGLSVVVVAPGRFGSLDGPAAVDALSAVAQRVHDIRTGVRFGGGPDAETPAVDLAAVLSHARDILAARSPMTAPERYEAMGVRVIESGARFSNPETLMAGAETIKARRYILLPEPLREEPPVTGLEPARIIHADTIPNLTDVPRHLLVLGGGATAIALAQAYRRFGSAVTMFVEGPRLLHSEDPEMTAIVARGLRAEAIDIRFSHAIPTLTARPDGDVQAGVGPGALTASHLLVANRQTAALADLGLDVAKVRTKAGTIAVDSRMRTSNARIYAAGPVASVGDTAIQATAEQAGTAFRHAIFRHAKPFDPLLVPRIGAFDPAFAAIGLTEEQAKAEGHAIRILRAAFADNARARARGRGQGHVKAVVTPSGRILGCTMVGPEAPDLIMPWALAMAKGLGVSDLADLAFSDASYGETTKRAAVEFLKMSAQDPWMRRVIGVLRRWS
ncbi:FAD-dependent oxidoreductase [Microvirga antarctica]|uniref:FAD-dependent oxidoreductase n=1 Tax=Microvirga antarctica TaxID=2819233 RepID=UPI001B3090FD|nr:NAD(P)/FAD-dependent oxidoreductase [Microvirga antarctica]